MQIKTTMRYHLTLVRMTAIKKCLQTINAGEGVEKREPSYTVGVGGNSAMENSVEIPLKTGNRSKNKQMGPNET